MASASSAWLDIFVGDRSAFEAQDAAYKRTQALLTKVADTYGLPNHVEDLDEEGRETLQSSNPSEELTFTPPQPLLAGRLRIELDQSSGLKKTRENFVALCTGSKGQAKSDKSKALHYVGVPLHRIVRGFVAQGGDVTRFDGSGGEAIYSGGKFAAESAGLAMTPEYGSLCMANSGRKDSISSQFFLVLADGTADAGSEKLKKLGGRQYVTFGKVMLAGEMGEEGQRVLQRLDEVATEDGKPTECVWVERCGVE